VRRVTGLLRAAFCLAASFTLAAGSAYAVDKQNRYLILGPGANYCSDILANLEQGAKLKNQAAVIIYSNWLAGSLTSYNRDTKATYSILGDMSFTDAFGWTLNYCKEHPSHIYSAAVDAFVHEYFDDRYTTMKQQAAKPPKAQENSGEDSGDDKDDEGK
jgi:hypothetical protein